MDHTAQIVGDKALYKDVLVGLYPLAPYTGRTGSLLLQTRHSSPDPKGQYKQSYVLQKAGLGEKKLTFKKNNDAEYFTDKICEVFPKLKDIGGFEILRTESGRRQMLDKLKVPPGGYTTAFLADESALGQAVCYLRPIQVDLDVEPDDVEGVQLLSNLLKDVSCF